MDVVETVEDKRWRLRVGMLWRLTLRLAEEGDIAGAMQRYRQLAPHVPSYEAFSECLAAFQSRECWTLAAAICEEWLSRYPDNTLSPHSNAVHKHHIEMLRRSKGIEAAFAYYGLTRQDDQPLDLHAEKDLVCCVVVRNESIRLPYFLDYHRSKGVTKFLIVDNDSTDETLSYLLSQPDVYTWQTAFSYRQANYGAAWWQLLLDAYCHRLWVLIVDADELFYYPNCDRDSIFDLCGQLTEAGCCAYRALQLDMYSRQAVEATYYQSGTDFLATCSYFDRQYYHVTVPQAGPFQNQVDYMGGVRSRIFGGRFENYILNKVPLFRYDPKAIVTSGQHWLNYDPDEFAKGRGALLHFKYFSTFSSHVQQEVIRKEHAGQATIYRQYASRLQDTSPLVLFDPAYSIELKSSQQLVDLGILIEQGTRLFPSSARQGKIAG